MNHETVEERHARLVKYAGHGNALTDAERALCRRIQTEVQQCYFVGPDGRLHRRRVPVEITDTPARHDADPRSGPVHGHGDPRYTLRRDGLE